jgi:hypothetical protein
LHQIRAVFLLGEKSACALSDMLVGFPMNALQPFAWQIAFSLI